MGDGAGPKEMEGKGNEKRRETREKRSEETQKKIGRRAQIRVPEWRIRNQRTYWAVGGCRS